MGVYPKIGVEVFGTCLIVSVVYSYVWIRFVVLHYLRPVHHRHTARVFGAIVSSVYLHLGVQWYYGGYVNAIFHTALGYGCAVGRHVQLHERVAFAAVEIILGRTPVNWILQLIIICVRCRCVLREILHTAFHLLIESCDGEGITVVIEVYTNLKLAVAVLAQCWISGVLYLGVGYEQAFLRCIGIGVESREIMIDLVRIEKIRRWQLVLYAKSGSKRHVAHSGTTLRCEIVCI